MANMKRFVGHLPPALHERLTTEAQKRGISAAELVRRIVDDYFHKQEENK